MNAPAILDERFQAHRRLEAKNSLAFGVGLEVAQVGVGKAVQGVALKERIVGAIKVIGALRVAAGLTVSAQCVPNADVNCSGNINSVDALFILRFVAGLPVTLPPGCPPIGSGPPSPTASPAPTPP